MAIELGLPVPPGFIVTTAACRSYLDGSWPVGLDADLHAAMDRLGARLGRRFGDAADPLLVSVRSGAPVSMPGMMDTILNLGLNDSTVRGLAKVAGEEFAQDCLRRLHEGYASVIGAGDVPDDPWQQLRAAVEAVFRSWNSDRARAYRARENIADDLGTAVTVQAMVFGNRGESSGTGVLFTRNPSTGENTPYGDVLFNAGDEGDRFYVIDSGELAVDLATGTKTEGPGRWVGEIALLRNVPRTATVRAVTDADLLALDRDEFLGAVTGHAPANAAANEIVGERLALSPV
jgi:phosphoenolpyruvate synthase/pyruvate phosphate dikinase